MKAVTGVGEWAECSYNIQTGCEHECLYCYAKSMAIRFGRATPETFGNPVEKDPLPRMTKHKLVMFPTAHDITIKNMHECKDAILSLVYAGNRVLIVTKAHIIPVRVLTNALKDEKNRVEFRFTIGSGSEDVLRRWEPGAPFFWERLESLKRAHSFGFKTSVSMEPILDITPGFVVEKVRPYVTQSIWIGRANRLMQTVSVNCPNDPEAYAMARELNAIVDDSFIRNLYSRYASDPLIRWKDSIKKVVGIPLQIEVSK